MNTGISDRVQLRIWEILLFLIGILAFLYPFPAAAVLDPREIRVIANRNAWGSLELAEYYMEKRDIPKENIVKLWITDKEWCTREEFENEAVLPVRKHLNEKDPLGLSRCLVTVYGIPLKVSPPALNTEEKKALEALKREQSRLSNLMWLNNILD